MLTSFAGIGFGWLLARIGVKQDREWQESQTVRERQENPCRIGGGYTCEGARVGTADRFAVTCGSASEEVLFVVTFDTGA